MKSASLVNLVLVAGLAGFAFYLWRKNSSTFLATNAGGQKIVDAVDALPITSSRGNSATVGQVIAPLPPVPNTYMLEPGGYPVGGGGLNIPNRVPVVSANPLPMNTAVPVRSGIYNGAYRPANRFILA